MTEPLAITTDEARWGILQRKVQAGRIAAIFTLFRASAIEPVLIKGFAADQYYPDTVFRSSIDVDLAVSASDFPKAQTLAASPEAAGFAIDLHRELRHLDTLPWSDLFENTRLIEVEGAKIRILRPEDHLRVLAVHWLNDGGIYREKLWDIHYLITNRDGSFDWSRALDAVGEKRRRWIVTAILLARLYFGLDLRNTPLENETLPTWLPKAVENAKPQQPLDVLTGQPFSFLKELVTRFRPNPVRATIEMEGSFDARTRVFYQFGNFFQRILPSLRKNLESIKK